MDFPRPLRIGKERRGKERRGATVKVLTSREAPLHRALLCRTR
jgi:hypothetical protein